MTEALTEAEVVALIDNAIRTSGPQTEEQLEAVIEWAHQARIAATLLDGLLNGHFGISVREGHIYFENAKRPRVM